MPAPSPAHLAHCNEHMLGLSMSRAAELSLVEQGPGRAVTRARVTPAVTGGHGGLDGTALYALLDYTAFLAVVTALDDAESAATHGASFTLTDAAPAGAELELTATLERRGRHVAFLSVRAAWVADGGERTIAFASVTKSVMPMTQRTRPRTPPSVGG
ncbi:MAG: PaaI family thioesterase [Alphaproteobacteria bacterium]|nr:PaaI family thioesterase [Alphaproteobacteria bacterium]